MSLLLLFGQVEGDDHADAHILGDAILDAAAQADFHSSSDLEGDSVIQATAFIGSDVTAHMDGGSDLEAEAIYIKPGHASLQGGSSITATAGIVRIGFASLIGGSNIVIEGRTSGLSTNRTYLYKVYSPSGNFLGIWDDVASDFGYSQEINSAGSAITVVLGRNSDTRAVQYDSLANDSSDPLITDDENELAAELSSSSALGAGTTVDLNLDVKIYEFSDRTTDLAGDLVFTGFIARYKSQYGETENTEVTLFSYGADLDNWLLTDGTTDGNTRVPYTAIDPSDIVKDILDKFTTDTDFAGLIDYAPQQTDVVTNYITNPSFEGNAATGWTGGGTPNQSASIVTTPVQSGTYARRISGTGPAAVTYTQMTLTVGVTYYVKGWIRTDTAQTVYVGHTSGGTTNSFTDLGISLPANVWTAFEFSFVASNTNTYIGVRATTTSTNVYYDNIGCFNADVPYFDGNTTDVAPVTYAWTGTTYQSTSTKTTITAVESVTDTGTTVNYTFNVNTGLEALKKCLELAPTDWFFYTDLATNAFHFHPRAEDPEHLFYLGRDVFSLNLEKSMEDIVNDVVFTGGKPSTVLRDTFSDSTTTSLASHNGDDGTIWALHEDANTGEMVIDGNRVRNNSGNESIYIAGTTADSNDYTVSADLRIQTVANMIELLARLKPTEKTYYAARINNSGNPNLYKSVNGTPTSLGTNTDITLVGATTNRLELVVSGNRISFKVNGTTAVDVTDTSIPLGGGIGIRSDGSGGAATASTGMQLNNFKVEQTSSAGVSVFLRYKDTDSMDDFRRGLTKIQDNRVTLEASADLLAASEINRNRDPRYTSSITISSATYDIRDIKLGDVIGFRNFGNFIDTIQMQVVRIDYTPDSVTLQLDTLLPSVPKRIEDIKRNLNQSEVEETPDAPEEGTI